jgi:hypothetical protein
MGQALHALGRKDKRLRHDANDGGGGLVDAVEGRLQSFPGIYDMEHQAQIDVPYSDYGVPISAHGACGRRRYRHG